MSNEKLAATFGPQVFTVGEWVYATQLPIFDHRLGQVDGWSPEKVAPYLVRFSNGDQYGAFTAEQLVPLGSGQQFREKLAADLAADYDRPSRLAPTSRVTRGPLKPVEVIMALAIMLTIVFLFVFSTVVLKIW